MHMKNVELEKLCKEKNVNKKGIEFLLEYYQKNLQWSEEEAEDYALSLFKDGTIDDIIVLNKND